MGVQTGSTALTTRLRRNPSRCQLNTDSIKGDITSQPPSAPFNSTSFLIRQQSQHREEQAVCPPTFKEFEELHICQYGSNWNSMIACCTFATNSHDLGCGYKSQADHPVIVGFSAQAEDLRMHSPHHQHHSSNGVSSGSRRKREDEASAEHEIRGRDRVKHRLIRSFQDDDFAILQSDVSCAKTLDEIVDEDLRDNFCYLGT